MTRIVAGAICLAIAAGAVAWADRRRCRWAQVTHIEGGEM